jgi:hypothetical protein
MTCGVFEQSDASGKKMAAAFALSHWRTFIRKCSVLGIEGLAHQIDTEFFWRKVRGRAYSNFDFLECLEHSGVVIATDEQVEHLLSKYGVEDVTTQK